MFFFRTFYIFANWVYPKCRPLREVYAANITQKIVTMKHTYLAPETEIMELQTERTVLDMSPLTTVSILSSNMSAESATLYNEGNEVTW